jgi:putative SOS response-associated peptidase YedK
MIQESCVSVQLAGGFEFIAMCARYVITSPADAIRALFGYAERPDFPPRYNVAPTQPIPVVRLADGRRSLALMRWGFLPAWVKDPRTFSLLVNARGESVLDKRSFRNAMRRRRCLIPANGFYEWSDAAPRRPYFVRPKSGAPIAFAGLWETWTGPNGEEVDTTAIVTTRANRALAAIHDRMPVIVAPEAFDLWLDSANVDGPTAAALIAPAADDTFEAYEISTAVNRATDDSAELLTPLSANAANVANAAQPAAAPAKKKKPDGQMSLF